MTEEVIEEEVIEEQAEHQACAHIGIMAYKRNPDAHSLFKTGFRVGARQGYGSALKELLECVEKDQAERQVQTINVLDLKAIIKEMGV